MSAASDEVPGQSPPNGADGSMAHPPGTPKGTKLRLIRTHLSDNGQCIRITFVDTQDQVMTVLLEIASATQFHQNLGTLLNQLKTLNQLTATEASRPLWN